MLPLTAVNSLVHVRESFHKVHTQASPLRVQALMPETQHKGAQSPSAKSTQDYQ